MRKIFTNNVFLSFKDAFDNIQIKLNRFDPISVERFLNYLEYCSMSICSSEECLVFIDKFKIFPWYVSNLYTIFLMSKNKNHFFKYDAITDIKDFMNVFNMIESAELLLIDTKMFDPYAILPNYKNIQFAFIDSNQLWNWYLYDWLMNDVENNKWFMEKYDVSFHELIVLLNLIKCVSSSFNEDVLNKGNVLKNIYEFLAKYNFFLKKISIEFDSFYNCQRDQLTKWEYNFFSVPLVIKTNPVIKIDDKYILISPKYLFTYLTKNIDIYLGEKMKGNYIGSKLEKFFELHFKNYRYAKYKYFNYKYSKKELFDIGLSDGDLLVCIDIKKTSVFNNIYLEDQNDSIIDKIYNYIIQRLKNVKLIVESKLKIADKHFSSDKIYSLIIFKETQYVSKDYVRTKILERLKKSEYNEMINYFENNLIIGSYSMMYEYMYTDANIFNDLKNEDNKGFNYFNSHRLSNEININYDSWYKNLEKSTLNYIKCYFKKNSNNCF